MPETKMQMELEMSKAQQKPSLEAILSIYERKWQQGTLSVLSQEEAENLTKATRERLKSLKAKAQEMRTGL